MIKRWIQFINESSDYKYGCVMIDIPFNNWDEITSIIDKDDLYIDETDDTYGIQHRPHLTLKYGLHSDVSLGDVKDCFLGVEYVDVVLSGLSLFKNDKFDVLKFDVLKNNNLSKVNGRLSELPNSDEFPDYKPHVTIAYLKKGMGDKYLELDFDDLKTNFKISDIIYSKDGNYSKFNLSTNPINESIKSGISDDYIDDLLDYGFDIIYEKIESGIYALILKFTGDLEYDFIIRHYKSIISKMKIDYQLIKHSVEFVNYDKCLIHIERKSTIDDLNLGEPVRTAYEAINKCIGDNKHLRISSSFDTIIRFDLVEGWSSTYHWISIFDDGRVRLPILRGKRTQSETELPFTDADINWFKLLLEYEDYDKREDNKSEFIGLNTLSQQELRENY